MVFECLQYGMTARLFYDIYLFYACVGAHVSQCTYEREKFLESISPNMWITGIQLRSSGMAASPFIP